MKRRTLIRRFLSVAAAAVALAWSPIAQAQLLNTSVRVKVGTGDDILITGFVVGATPKTFLFRAVGPGLTAFGVNGVLADPVMTLFSGQNVVARNDDWGSSALAGAIAEATTAVGAFALAGGSKDSAMLATLQPGAYTVQIVGLGGTSGVALFEAYETAVVAPPVATGTLRGAVRDGVTNAPLSGATVAFTNASGETLGSATTSATGEYSVTLAAGAVTAAVSMTGYVSTTLAATVAANTTVQAKNVIIAQNTAGNGVLSGRITNALTGQGLAGATLQLRSGVNAVAGTVIATATTTSAGDYTMNVVGGSYTCEVTLAGYVNASFNCVAVGTRTINNQNYAVSPVLSGDSLRIVLTWGATPVDLDVHLTGPTTGTSRFHVYYASNATNGVKLDVEDISSYGPETITVSQFVPGVYRYSVHDYSNATVTTSSVLSNLSGAQVRVIQGGTELATFNVPTGRTGNLWTVFEMDGATRTLTPKNQISNIASSNVVPYPRDGVIGEPEVAETELYFRLPPKK